jgi:membrane-bound lytic murein transglycosylase D
MPKDQMGLFIRKKEISIYWNSFDMRFHLNLNGSVTLGMLLLIFTGCTAGSGLFRKKKMSSPIVPLSDFDSTLDTSIRNSHTFWDGEGDPFIAVAPEIPESVEFCGKIIDLRRNDLRERFDREMLAMMYMHSATLTLLKRANRYFPVIEPILKANGIPDDIKYLACIESTLNPRAVSTVKAVGMWQFMPETAKQYGLEVNDYVDERYNVEKETQAACDYLKEAYKQYKDWGSACAAYNAGTNRINSELTKQQASSGLDLWLVEETQRYVFRILACKVFFQNPKKYGFFIKGDQLYQPIQFRDSVVTSSVSDWVSFARVLNITYYELKAYNSWIRGDSLPNPGMKTYKVSIPLKESRYFDEKKVVVHQKNWVTDSN